MNDQLRDLLNAIRASDTASWLGEEGDKLSKRADKARHNLDQLTHFLSTDPSIETKKETEALIRARELEMGAQRVLANLLQRIPFREGDAQDSQ